MKEIEIKTLIQECGYDELSADDRELVDAAKEMTRGSYAPYSNFHVGAALRLADGSVATGSNQENVAYPSGICAERTAIWHASAVKPGMAVKTIAVAASVPDGQGDVAFQQMPISPCGACRQALLEYEHRDGKIKVILYGLDKIYIFPSVASLLPYNFTEF